MREQLTEIILQTARKDAEYFLSLDDNRSQVQSMLKEGGEAKLQEFLVMEMQSLEENNMDAAIEGNGLFNPDGSSMKDLYFSDERLQTLYYETAMKAIIDALRVAF